MKTLKILILGFSLIFIIGCHTVRIVVSAPNVLAPASLSNYVSLNKNENETLIITDEFNIAASKYYYEYYYYMIYWYMSGYKSRTNNLMEERIMDMTEGSSRNALKNIVIESNYNQFSMNLYVTYITRDTLSVKLTGDVIKFQKIVEDTK